MTGAWKVYCNTAAALEIAAKTTMPKATTIATPLPSRRISLNRSAFISSSLRIRSPLALLGVKNRQGKRDYQQYDPYVRHSRYARENCHAVFFACLRSLPSRFAADLNVVSTEGMCMLWTIF